MKTTSKLNLNLPEYTDVIDIQKLNDNFTTLDTEVDSKAKASDLTSHTGNTSNPHGVTKTQVGLGNVPNVATNDQTPTYTAASTLATLTSGEKLSVSMGKIMKAITDLISHIGNKSNPHAVTKAQVGLGNVDNTSDADKPVSTAQATAIADAKKAGTDAQTTANTAKSTADTAKSTADSALEAAEAARGIAEGLAASSYSITLTPSGWVADSTFSDYGFKYAYTLSGITSSSIAEMYLDAPSVIVANEAGVLTACETVSGAVNFYAASVPTSNITGRLIVSSETPLGSITEGLNPDDYVQKAQIGVASGVASLGSDGKVPTTQLPAMDYIPNSKLGTASGVATLGSDGKVPSSQLPTIGGHVVSASQPSDTNLLWIDTGNGGVLKYYNGSAWVGIAAVYA